MHPAVALFLLVFAPSIRATEPLRVKGHVAPQTKSSVRLGRLRSEQQLRLAFGLSLRNRDELEMLLRRLYDPGDPSYQHYLVPSEFTARFGPTVEDYAHLIEFCQSNRLQILATHPNRLVLDVSGAVVDIERALGTTLALYQHPTEKRTFFSAEAEPILPANVPLLHVSGLNNFLLPRPAGLTRTPASSLPVPQSGAGPGGTFRGSDFRGAYARGVTLTGAGQMVGLLEFDGFYPSDITAYQSQTQNPNVPIISVLLDGFDGTPSNNDAEVALDIEMVESMAPGLAALIVYQAGPGGFGDDILSRMANDNLARQLGASWTFPTDPVTDQIFLQFAAQGQSYFNASGDAGAYVGPVSAPADNPNVTVVGGTQLSTTGPGGAWTGETVWNRGATPVAATGGGTSTFYAIPSWQAPVKMSANQGSTTMRNLPDVAAVADNVWIAYNNGSTETVGGTSCSTPLWAGFMALVNQQAAGFGRPPIGFLNPALYRLGLGAGYSTNFHDITIGNNTNSDSPLLFAAAPGYDLCTGWGSPFGQNLINALAPRWPMPVMTNLAASLVSEGCSPPNLAIDPNETVTVSLSIKNIGGIRTSNLVATLLPAPAVRWPGPAQSYGAIAPGGAAARNFAFTAGGNCGDSIILTLQLQDGQTDLGNLRFNFQLGKPIVTLLQNFDSVAAPALPAGWTTMASNGVSTWVTSSVARDSSPNAAFADEPPLPGAEDLISPSILLSSTNAQLSFRQFYNTEADPVLPDAYDGGFLEIQIGTNDFVDILDAGGNFLAGGYNRAISTQTNSDNPFAGHAAWGGNSGGFVSTVVSLPASAAGQSVQFRWRFAVDTGNFFGGTGWYIDTVALRDGASCCSPSADVALTGTVSPDLVSPGQPLNFSVAVTNSGPGTAFGVLVTNSLLSDALFVSGSPGCSLVGGAVLCDAGTLVAGGSTNFTFSVVPAGVQPLTNIVLVSAYTPDPDVSNNRLLNVSTIASNAPPAVLIDRTNFVQAIGSSLQVQATGFGDVPLTYQWLFGGTPIEGQTSASLLLTNLQAAQTGDYAIIVTNLNGASVAAHVLVTVVQPPTIKVTGLANSNTAPALTFTSAVGLAYILEFSQSLAPANWTAVSMPITGTGLELSLGDTNATRVPAGFYRLSAHP